MWISLLRSEGGLLDDVSQRWLLYSTTDDIEKRPHAFQGDGLSATGTTSLDTKTLTIRSDSLKRVMMLAEKVSRHPAAVLIAGETGTGKEMIARIIHNHSLRCNQPWIDVNCAAIPEHLVESELFGYEKGAFSGADTLKPGLFELADKGTLFLDEIGDLELKVQVKLLRVLDGVPYYRLGGSKKVSVDVRVVAATNQDLEELVRVGRFRGDLYHRLAQFKLEVPPVRQRPEDILGIAEHVLHEHYPESHYTEDAIDALLGYAWPGNVRELKNVIFSAVLQAKNPGVEITAVDLQLPDPALRGGNVVPMNGDLNQVERQMIFQALEKLGGNQSKAALMLGISRRTLIRKLKVYRETGAEAPAGALNADQQRYYRIQLDLPIGVKSGDELHAGILLNLSLGGAAITTDSVLKFGTLVALCLSIPEIDLEAEISGRVAWSNKDGEHGIKFTELPPALRTTLQRWLLTQMKKEGWESEAVGQ
jgi:transcriptional regulator with PAS, ATPase and Fis domain